MLSRITQPLALIAGVVLLLGCGADESWMPLRKDNEWKYLVRQSSGVMTVRVIERARVGRVQGWRLDGEGGESRLAWVHGELNASALTAMTFKPPLVLLKPKTNKANWPWKGVAVSRSKPSNATATFSQSAEQLRFGGIERQTLKVVMKMKYGNTNIELTTWYERGVGMLQQEQRNNDDLVASLVLTGNR